VSQVPSKYLITVVFFVGVCIAVLALYAGRGMEKAQTEENAQMKENVWSEHIFSISELVSNPENFENGNVRISGTIIKWNATSFSVKDDTGKIVFGWDNIIFPYNTQENFVITLLVFQDPVSSIWDPYHLIDMEKAENEKPSEYVAINEISPNIENFDNQIVKINVTIISIETCFIVSDNTGEMLCKHFESFPYNLGENVTIEGMFVIHRDATGGIHPRIHVQKIENALKSKRKV
jgi:hypothetical protein